MPEEIITTTDKAHYDVMAGARSNFIENRVAPLVVAPSDPDPTQQDPSSVDTTSGSGSMGGKGKGK